MFIYLKKTSYICLGLSLVLCCALKSVHAQEAPIDVMAGGPEEEEEEEEEIIPELPTPGGEFEPEPSPPLLPEEKVEVGEAGEGETRWNIDITGAVIMNYVFNDSPDNFIVKYRWEVKGQANAATAVITGNADISAEANGPLSKWPTGECRLEISVPSVPFELTFRRASEDRGSLKLVFKSPISEDWQSKCLFDDAPGAKFDTRGAPEAWLNKALEKARPPLKDIIAEMGSEESTTGFIISKDTIDDPPLGTIEIEGTGAVTIKPGG